MSVPFPPKAKRLSPQEKADFAAYGEADTRKLKKHKRASRLLDFVTGLLSAGGSLYTHWMFTEHALNLENILVNLLMFVLALAAFLWSTSLRDGVEDALLISPIEAYFRLDGLEDEIRELEQELERVVSRRESEIRLLEHAGADFIATFGSWTTLLQDTHLGTLEFSRWVNSHLEKPPAQRVPNDELLQEVDERFHKLLDNLVEVLKRDRVSLFGHDPSISFFDVFELQKDACVRLARATHGHPTEHDRSWPVSQGHIGEAILLSKALLKNIPPEQRDLGKEPNSAETDPEYFQAAIYAPIPAIDRRPHNFYGVLVVTSSTLDGLNKAHLGLVNTLAHSLAGAFITRQRSHKRLANRNLYGIRSAASSGASVSGK